MTYYLKNLNLFVTFIYLLQHLRIYVNSKNHNTCRKGLILFNLTFTDTHFNWIFTLNTNNLYCINYILLRRKACSSNKRIEAFFIHLIIYYSCLNPSSEVSKKRNKDENPLMQWNDAAFEIFYKSRASFFCHNY